MAIEGMYARCQRHSCVEHREGLGLVEQLRVVGNFVGDLAAIAQANAHLLAGLTAGPRLGSSST